MKKDDRKIMLIFGLVFIGLFAMAFLIGAIGETQAHTPKEQEYRDLVERIGELEEEFRNFKEDYERRTHD